MDMYACICRGETNPAPAAAPYHISDTSLGAECLRLVAEHLKGDTVTGKSFLNLTTSTALPSGTRVVAPKPGATDRANYLYIVATDVSSSGSTVSTWTINLGAWLGAGSGGSLAVGGHPVIVTMVHGASVAEVEQLHFTTPGSATMKLDVSMCLMVLL